MTNIAVLASHNGTNIDAIIEAIKTKHLDAKLSLIITNNTNANVLQKAKSFKIDSYVVNTNNFPYPDEAIANLLQQYHCDFVVLAGYMKKLSSLITDNFNVINSHPSLLPKYGGTGMYGRFVHEAVIANKETKSGVSIHFVNEEYDDGKIILQKEIALDENETIDSLEKKVKEIEKKAIVEALKKCLK
ncbi:MAG: phosphoribosylglycinamide formyltransferase [Campylobacterales bacterium]|nr:phosphoribosylglycinamide formyltransferase [Campylobacterales bacterium]